jgi:hypothetical protein
MIYNAAMPAILNNMLKSVVECVYPNNPRNKKKEKRPVKYLFVSTQFVEKIDKAGVVHRLIKGTSCKRTPPKPLSKRDIHRKSQEN